MDTGWSDIQRMFGAIIVKNVHAGFVSDPPDCIIIQHGHRIIAASVVNRREGIENHLATGPSVLQEYRGRGPGRSCLGLRSPLCVMQASRKLTESAVKNRPLPGSCIQIRRRRQPMDAGF